MSNLHGQPDTMAETHAHDYDLLPACIISTTWPTVPVSSVTFAPFATKAYVREVTTLTYVDQPAAAVSLSTANGQWWLAVHKDTYSSVTDWIRQPGTHYLVRGGPATQPADPLGGLLFAGAVVAGGVITSVTPVPSPPLSRQNANQVAITGGTATGLSSVTTIGNVGIGHPTPTLPLYVIGSGYVSGQLGVGIAPTNKLHLYYNRAAESGLVIHQNADSGIGTTVIFQNGAGGIIGSISTTGAATAYNTSSDIRLKKNIETLVGALGVVHALKPVQFTWKADDLPGHGFLAQEVEAVVPGVITGEADAVDADGAIVPQQIDHSKLVPWLCGAIQELAAQVEALTARLEAAGG